MLPLLFSAALLASALGGHSATGGGALAVLNKSDATATLLEPRSGDALATFPTGTGPHEAAVSPDGRFLVVCDYGAGTPGRTLTVYDLESGEVTRTIDLGAPRRPHGIQFETASRAIVTAEASRAILRVDVALGEVLDVMPTEQEVSHMVALSPDRKRAFVANIGSGSTTVIDLATGKIEKQIPTGGGAEGIAVTPDGSEVWVSNRAADTLSVIDASSLEVAATIPCASFPIRVAITPDGRRALISNARSGDVAVFDVASREELRRVPMEATPAESTEGRLFGGEFGASPVPVGILVQPDGARAYVANTNADVVTILDLETWTIAGRLKAGREPDGMAWCPRAPRPKED